MNDALSTRALEKKLASLLGWTDIHNLSSAGLRRGSTIREPLPRWTEDDGTCFRLMVEHEIRPLCCASWCETFSFCEASFYIVGDSDPRTIVERTSEHADKFAAMRVAVVRAVVAKLEGELT